MQHKYIQHTRVCEETSRCPVCAWGCQQCETCGLAEGWLTTECPGVPVPYTAGELVAQGKLDFIGGKWVNK